MADKFIPFGQDNVPIKAVDNGDGTYSFSTSSEGGGAGGPDREFIVSYFRATNAFTGASVGDLIRSVAVYDLSGADPVQVGTTDWSNETTQLPLASAPSPADLEPAMGATGVTNAELVAALATQTGTKTTASAALPAGGSGIVGWLSNVYHSFFGVAVGATDSGNPIKTGGVYISGNGTALATGQRGQTRLHAFGATLVLPFWGGDVPADGATNSTVALHQAKDGGTGVMPATANWLYNGSTWDRTRGNTAGAFVQGNVGNAVADTGNPVKIGAIYNSAAVPVGNGQRTNLQANVNGSMLVVPENGAALTDIATTAYALNSRGGADVFFGSVPMLYTGSAYVRARGDTTGAAVNTLKQPLVARQIAVSSSSNPVALTAGVKRVSIYARGGDMRFRFANATTTAVATDHFIAQGERLDLNCEVGATPWIAVIRDGATDGTLELSELS